MRLVHAPIWLGSVSRPTAAAFLVLFTLEATCRALLVSLIPLRAHGLLGDAQSVSLVYFAVSGIGLAVSLGVPALVHIIRRRWVVSIGATFYMLSAALFSIGTLPALVAGMACQIAGTACLEIALNLYLMDHVPRQDMGRFEPRRLLFAGGMFIIGPWLGVYLANNVTSWATYAIVGTAGATLLVYFWFLRITDNPSVTQRLRRPPNPLTFLPRYFTQPRLLLAWLIAIGRTSWWMMFFIYSPILITNLGFGQETAAAVVSIGTCAMLLVPLWGRIGRTKGIRYLLTLGFVLTAIATLGAVGAGLLGMSWGVLIMIAAAGFCASLMDGAGNIPFLRAVHPYERGEMTAVYVTFRYAANIATPGLFAVVLSVFTLPAVFVTGGLMSLGSAGLSRFLPKRM